MIRRDAIVGIGGFDEDIYGADDWDLFIRLAKQAPVAVSPHHEVYYRIVKGSGSAQVEKIEQGCLKVVNKAFKIAPLELQPLQNKSLGIVYQYLCFRTLEEAAQQSSGLQAIRYFNKSYRCSPELWGFPTLSKFFLRAFIIALLPPKLSRVITIKMRQCFS
ncbi:MAG: hypothetical protein F6K00_09070 [Leptolyngbya sp. SIOISBB]|nr:hypothetical protein [Leptolyngbya sp. SIOISBB]